MINEMSLKIIHFLQPLLSSFYCAKDVYNLHIGRPCLIALFFLMPFLEIEGLWQPYWCHYFQQYSLTWCLCVTVLSFS